MPKKLLATTIILAFVVAMLSAMSMVGANFLPVNNSINILSPVNPLNLNSHQNYQNSEVNLTISVVYVKEGSTEPPKVYSISYSLDGQPLAYLRNISVSNYNYTQYNQNITAYVATTTLENLSDGKHTVNAYANNMSTSLTFTVDSNYVFPIMKILSPTNQTYNGTVPLVFAINTNFTKVSYLMRLEKNIDTHFEGRLSGNSSLQNLPNGNYFLDLSATTNYGELIGAAAYFTINSGPTMNTSIIYIILSFVIVIVAVASISLVYFRRRKGKP
jgi:hypothetical protein